MNDKQLQTRDVPIGNTWLDDVRRYERDVLSKRS
jgi:L-rhamnose isomerase